MFTKTCIILLMASAAVFADDIFLKNGNVILNCEKSFENEYRVFVNTSDGVKIYEWDEIEYYKAAPYDPEKPTEFTKRQTLSPGAGSSAKSGTIITGAKLPVILLSASGIALSLDILIDVNEFDMPNDLSDRKQLIGMTGLITSSWALVYGLLMEN